MRTDMGDSMNATMFGEIFNADAIEKCAAHPAVAYVGMACVYWFTFELLVRFAISPDKRRFAVQPYIERECTPPVTLHLPLQQSKSDPLLMCTLHG